MDILLTLVVICLVHSWTTWKLLDVGTKWQEAKEGNYHSLLIKLTFGRHADDCRQAWFVDFACFNTIHLLLESYLIYSMMT